MIKQRLKSKTYWLGMAAVGIGIAEQNFSMISDQLGNNAGWVYIVLGMAGFGVRELTKGPVSDK